MPTMYVAGLDSERTCNNICSKSDDSSNDKYWAIINNYDHNTDKVDLFKAYKLNFDKFEFVEIDNNGIKCEIIQGED